MSCKVEWTVRNIRGLQRHRTSHILTTAEISIAKIQHFFSLFFLLFLLFIVRFVPHEFPTFFSPPSHIKFFFFFSFFWPSNYSHSAAELMWCVIWGMNFYKEFIFHVFLLPSLESDDVHVPSTSRPLRYAAGTFWRWRTGKKNEMESFGDHRRNFLCFLQQFLTTSTRKFCSSRFLG